MIALNAHGDVVPPGLGWTADPYGAEVRDGDMYGRGVAVSKSDFATYAFALLALKASGAPLAGAVELHFTYDEEVGGAIGPAWLLAQAIAARLRDSARDSPTASRPRTTVACISRSRSIGKSGHAASRKRGSTRWRRRRACSPRCTPAQKLRGDEVDGRGHRHATLVVGLIKGGTNTNVVPDRVAFRLDRRIIPEENPADAEAALTRQIRERAPLDRVTRDVRRILLAVPFVPIAGPGEAGRAHAAPGARGHR